MGPSRQFCPNFSCAHRGKPGLGNIKAHSRKERRCRCGTRGKTFAATRNAPFYRRHKPLELVTAVLTLLTHGCPPQAIVAALALDERTVADWQLQAGRHARRFHQLHVQQGQADAEHAPADGLYVKRVGRKPWLALALAVPTRLWPGGALSRRRDRRLIAAVVLVARSCPKSLAVLVCVGGLASYAGAFVSALRRKVQGARGRPRLVAEAGLLIGQVIERYGGRRLTAAVRRVARGSLEAVGEVLRRTGTGAGTNTSYVERLNATSRASLTGLVRRGRALLRQEGRMEAGGDLVGCASNFCREHDSRRAAAPPGAGRKWAGRAPAMAGGLTERVWSLAELLGWRVVPAQGKAPRKQPRRRRRRAATPAPATAAARSRLPGVLPCTLVAHPRPLYLLTSIVSLPLGLRCHRMSAPLS